MNSSFCIFCQNDTPEKTCMIATMEVSQKIIACAQNDHVIRCRLDGYSDLVAADARYHLKCYVKFFRKSQSRKPDEEMRIRNNAIKRLCARITTGDIYNLAAVWEQYSDILSEHGVEAGQYSNCKSWFKDKLKDQLNDKIDFVPQLDQRQPQLIFLKGSEKQLIQTLKDQADELNESREGLSLQDSRETITQKEEMLAVYHTAIQIRADVKESPTLNNCSSVTVDDAEHMVPNRLFMFLNVLLTGDEDDCVEEKKTRTLVLSIAQDIIYALSKGKKITPKHTGLGMAIHQATRSKNLVNLVHNAGHCISYDQVRRLDTTLAKKALDQYSENGNMPIPTNIAPGHFFQFSADNIDIIEETLDGRGTFHATQMVAFQRAVANTEEATNVEEVKLCPEKSLKSSVDLHALIQAPHSDVRPTPVFEEQAQVEDLNPESPCEIAKVKDLAWLLARMRDSSGTGVPSWTGYNQVVTTVSEELTTVGYLPILNAPAHDKDTLWTVLMRCLHISLILNPGQSTVVPFDEQLYSKAKELQWTNPEMCKGLFLRLGGFHIAKKLHASYWQALR